MAFARVVRFDGVSAERVDRLSAEISSGQAPPEVPASEILLLHDADGQSALAILFFETEEDYARGDAGLNAMPAEGTPGRRSSVTRYRVAVRATAG